MKIINFLQMFLVDYYDPNPGNESYVSQQPQGNTLLIIILLLGFTIMGLIIIFSIMDTIQNHKNKQEIQQTILEISKIYNEKKEK